MAQSNQDERIARRPDDSQERGTRMSKERAVTQDREKTDAPRLAERLAMLRDVNTKLPSIPEISGFHTCWLTTNNQSDSLEHRFRLGYELINPAEVPGFSMPTQQSGTVTSDRIMINEMVAAKLPTELAVAYMKDAHIDQPAEQMRSLSASVRMDRDGRGREVGYTGRDGDGDFNNGVSDGFRTLGKTMRPSYSGVI